MPAETSASTRRKTQAVPKKPSLPRRFCAYATDWFAGDLFASFPVSFLYAVSTQDSHVTNSISEVPGNWALLAGSLSLCAIFLYYVFIPWKVWNGQTIGKRLFGIRIVSRSGADVSFKELAVRQIAGLMIIENGLVTAGRYFQDFIAAAGVSPHFLWWNNAGLVLGAVSALAVVFTPSGRALHDYLAGTRVAEARDSAGP